MTPAIYARVAPYLTVFTGQSAPDASTAAAPVLTAMGLDGPALVQAREARRPVPGEGGPAMGGAAGGTYSIQSVAHLREGRTAGIRAVIRTGGNGAPGSAYTALDWQEGTTAR